MAADRMILGDGPRCEFSTDSNETGVNNNVLVVASSGAGKTVSITEAMLLAVYVLSMIVIVTKRRIIDKYRRLLQRRGYEVLVLDYVHPDQGNVGYDPLDFICSFQDITFVAKSIVMSNPRKERSNADPYWDDAAVSLLSAEIAYVMITVDNPTFDDVLRMHENLTFEECGGQIKTNYDEEFEYLEQRDPSNFAVSCWKSFKKLPIRTSSCVFGTLNTTLDSIFTPELRKMFRLKKKVNFEELASRKTVLFVATSPVNPSLNCFINLFYSQAFKQLFEFGEEQPDGKLPVPVHVIADDFATGCPVYMFDQYISIFREKGISVTLLIQSESQLSSTYGSDAATTIINNCDSYVFLGSNDLRTAQNISLRANLPLEDVLYMPVGSEILFRRGQKPIMTKRYSIMENELYQKVTREYERRITREKEM